MKKFLPLAIVLITAFVVWALLGFPQDFDSVSTRIFGVFSLLGTIFTTTKGIKEAFFDKPSKTLIEELSDQTHPLKVQLVDPVKEVVLPTARADSLKKIRGLSSAVSRDQVAEDVARILGDKSELFWKRVDADTDGILFSLAQDGFWLEGLVLIFEQNKGTFPKNPGKLLDLVLKAQWNESKLNISDIPAIQTLQFVLGKTGYRKIYSHEYLLNTRSVEHASVYERDLGELPPPLKKNLLRRMIESVYEKKQNSKNAVRYFWGLTLIVLRLPGNFLFSLMYLLSYPFYRLGSILRGSLRDTEKGKKLYASMASFFSRFNFSEIRIAKRGRHFLNCAIKGRILELSGKSIRFAQPYWRDYFIASYVAAEVNKAKTYELEQLISTSRIRQYPERINIVIVLCGLIAEPQKFISYLMPIDPVAAGASVADGFEISQNLITADSKDKLVADLYAIVRVPERYEPSYCYHAAKLLQKVSNDPSYAGKTLESFTKNNWADKDYEISRIIAGYGSSVLLLLTKRLNEPANKNFHYDMVTLGEIGDIRAIPVLQKFLSDDDYEKQIMALIVLSTYFDDQVALKELSQYLLFHYDSWDSKLNKGHTYPGNYTGGFAWRNVDARREKAIPVVINALRYAAEFITEDKAKKMNGWYSDWYSMKEYFVNKIKHGYQEEKKRKEFVEELLLNALDDAPIHDFKITIIKSLNAIKSEKAATKLFDVLMTLPLELENSSKAKDGVIDTQSELNELQAEIIDILRHAPNNEAILKQVLGLLESEDPSTVNNAIWVLYGIKNDAAVNPLIEILRSEKIALYPIGTQYPIALTAMKALAHLDTKKAKDAARQWAKAHQDDQFKVGFTHGYKTVASEVDLALQTTLIPPYYDESE